MTTSMALTDEGLARVKSAMADGQWRTLDQIAAKADVDEYDLPSYFRRLKKPVNGGLRVEKYHVGNNLYRFRIAKG